MNNYTEEQKEKVCNLVYEWMVKHGCWGGEMAMQDDDCQIYAIELVSDLADVVGVEDDNDYVDDDNVE